MNIEESVNELEKIKEMFIHLKNYGWINDIKRDIDVDKAIESIETLLTAYEKEKEKNSKAIGHIEACKTSLGNYILSPNETESLLSILKEE